MSGYEDDHDKSQDPFSKTLVPFNRGKNVDTHEMLKKELYQQAGVPDPSYAARYAIPGFSGTAGIPYGGVPGSGGTPGAPGASNDKVEGPQGIVDRYFYLDTDFKDSASNLTQGELVFDISQLNQSKPIEQIIEMEMSDFFFPEIDTGVQFPSYFFFRRMYAFIREMAGQAVFADGNKRFHFEFGVQPSGISNATTRVGGHKFIFTTPFRDLSRATFVFTKPPNFSTVMFEQDNFNFNAVAGSAPAQITTTVPHGLTIGDDVSIFLSGFGSDVGNIDSLVNSQDGHLVNVTNTTTLTFDPIGTTGFDFTNVTTAVPGTFLVGFRRIAFTIRFRSTSEKETNTIVAV